MLTSRICLPNKAICFDGKGVPLPLYFDDQLINGRIYAQK